MSPLPAAGGGGEGGTDRLESRFGISEAVYSSRCLNEADRPFSLSCSHARSFSVVVLVSMVSSSNGKQF